MACSRSSNSGVAISRRTFWIRMRRRDRTERPMARLYRPTTSGLSTGRQARVGLSQAQAPCGTRAAGSRTEGTRWPCARGVTACLAALYRPGAWAAAEPDKKKMMPPRREGETVPLPCAGRGASGTREEKEGRRTRRPPPWRRAGGRACVRCVGRGAAAACCGGWWWWCLRRRCCCCRGGNAAPHRTRGRESTGSLPREPAPPPPQQSV
eukprot:scaffold266_cov391-Prasinococcus_capsulatus_cf.AAC.37